MIVLLIGHRGVGKSSLLRRIEFYRRKAQLKPALFFDLDREIEIDQKKSIADIFEDQGEQSFRQIEELVLNKLIRQNAQPMFIALGAGYCKKIPPESLVIWISRESDKKGRIFLDRPRLNSIKSPLEEYWERFEERQRRYESMSHLQWVIREGIQSWDSGEFQFFTGEFSERSGIFTIADREGDLRSKELGLKLPWERLEIRDDGQTWENDVRWLNYTEAENLLFSRRSVIKKMDSPIEFWDWALELGNKKHPNAQIISIHEKEKKESLLDLLKRLEKYSTPGQILKAAPLVDSFEELLLGHEWQQQDPLKRCFLPRSMDGRWKWYRLFMKGKMPLNFWRLDQKILDQPTLSEWLNHPQRVSHFAAILGDPVIHSHTPVEQEEFFRQYKWPVYAIKIAKEHWIEASSVLKKLGIKAAAVTAPLKQHAYSSCDKVSKLAQDLQSVNTLFWHEDTIQGDNTDLYGFQAMVGSLVEKGKRIAIWGGGGTLEMMKKALPLAQAFSARSALPREEQAPLEAEVVIWSCGRHKDYKYPPENWPLEIVIDLSYSEDSQGKELALLRGLKYISGETMFKAQAKKQREFWSKQLEGK